MKMEKPSNIFFRSHNGVMVKKNDSVTCTLTLTTLFIEKCVAKNLLDNKITIF